MKKYLLALSAVLFVGLTSCKDTAKEAPAETTETQTEAPAVVDDHAGHDHAPGQGHDAPQTTGNLNPAHGEPGHRCDIPTGAPLDSAPNTPAISAQTAPAQGGQPFLVNDEAKARMAQESGQTVPQGAKGSGQTNPPHGQPGHRCDVPVGQPL